MYIYHALINALSAHMIHMYLNVIFYTHVEHSPTKTIYIKYYLKKQNKTHYKHACAHTHTHTHTHAHMCARTHTHTHTHTHTLTLHQQNNFNSLWSCAYSNEIRSKALNTKMMQTILWPTEKKKKKNVDWVQSLALDQAGLVDWLYWTAFISPLLTTAETWPYKRPQSDVRKKTYHNYVIHHYLLSLIFWLKSKRNKRALFMRSAISQ